MLQIERAVEQNYKAAQNISFLRAESLKDLYWRKWKATIVSDLDRLTGTISAELSEIGMRCQVCHAQGKRGATIFIESTQLWGRKWVPTPKSISTRSRALSVPPLPPAPASPAIEWPHTRISPENSYAIQQILLGDLPSLVRVPNKRVLGSRSAPASQAITVSGACVPVCTLTLFTLAFSNWTVLPDIRSAAAGSVIRKDHYMKQYGFMSDDVISEEVFVDIQNRIESQAKVRYVIASVISRNLINQDELKSVFMEYWDGTTEQLFANLATEITRKCLGRVGLKLCCDWTTLNISKKTAIKVKAFSIQTANGQPWRGPPSVRLQTLYPFGNYNLDACIEVENEIECLMGNIPHAAVRFPHRLSASAQNSTERLL
jgi:hypothetical protein